MATILTHAFVAAALVDVAAPRPRPKRLWLVACACAIAPDADAFGYFLGVEYDSLFGHRGITHSILFALALATAAVAVFFRREPRAPRLFVLLIVATLSHGVLDAMTNGGLGVAFFSPFDTTRVFLPWRPIQVAPISLRPSHYLFEVLGNEALWVWLPTVFIALAARALRALRPRTASRA